MKTEQANHPSDRPLITFALFAYNQERFIREAVAGAFSQTYSPLEIILSDDCSSDRTFEIIQEMTAGYEGPHKVILNRNEKNPPPFGNSVYSARGNHYKLQSRYHFRIVQGRFFLGARG